MNILNSLNHLLLQRIFLPMYIIFYPILFNFEFLDLIFYTSLCIYTFVTTIISAIKYADVYSQYDLLFFGFDLKYLKTIHGSYWYSINYKCNRVILYKKDFLWFTNKADLPIYSSTTTKDIEEFLERNTNQINSKYTKMLAEEMSTWKQKN